MICIISRDHLTMPALIIVYPVTTYFPIICLVTADLTIGYPVTADLIIVPGKTDVTTV